MRGVNWTPNAMAFVSDILSITFPSPPAPPPHMPLATQPPGTVSFLPPLPGGSCHLVVEL